MPLPPRPLPAACAYASLINKLMLASVLFDPTPIPALSGPRRLGVAPAAPQRAGIMPQAYPSRRGPPSNPRRELRELAGRDRRTDLPHQLQVEMQVVQRRQAQSEDLIAAIQVAQVGARIAPQVEQLQAGSIGPVSAWCAALRMLMTPEDVNRWPLRACRVGITQSNRSTPRATAATMSCG